MDADINHYETTYANVESRQKVCNLTPDQEKIIESSLILEDWDDIQQQIQKNQLKEKDCLVEEEKISKKLGRNTEDKLTNFEAEVSDFPSQRLPSEAWGIRGQQLQRSADNQRPSKFYWIQAEIARNDAQLKSCREHYATLMSKWNAFIDEKNDISEWFLQIGTSLMDINEELERVSGMLGELRGDPELTRWGEQLVQKTPQEFTAFDKRVIEAATRNFQVISAAFTSIKDGLSCIGSSLKCAGEKIENPSIGSIWERTWEGSESDRIMLESVKYCPGAFKRNELEHEINMDLRPSPMLRSPLSRSFITKLTSLTSVPSFDVIHNEGGDGVESGRCTWKKPVNFRELCHRKMNGGHECNFMSDFVKGLILLLRPFRLKQAPECPTSYPVD